MYFQKLSAFSLLLADTVRINAEGIPEILTKIAKDFVSVSYNINDKVRVLQWPLSCHSLHLLFTCFNTGFNRIPLCAFLSDSTG